MRDLLFSEHYGFMGKTHWLMSTAMFIGLWHMPHWVPLIGPYLSKYLVEINSSYIFLVLIFAVMGGASLIPDLDSSKMEGGNSTAGEKLGFLGSLISLGLVSMAHVVWSVLHLPGDEKPKSGHRLIWHAGIVPSFILFWMLLTFPNTNQTVSRTLNLHNLAFNISLTFAVVLLSVSVYIGINQLLYRLLSLVGYGRYVQIGGWIGFSSSLFAFYTMPFSQMRLLGITFAIGYLFHVIEDVFSKGGVPLLFPIPIPEDSKMKMWFKHYIPYNIAVETGGVINTILDYIFWFVDGVLIYITFFAK